MTSSGTTPTRKEVVRLLRQGFKSAQHIGGILANIITANPKVKIIVEIRDAQDVKTYQGAFQDCPDQRMLVETILLRSIFCEPDPAHTPIVVEIYRTKEFLSVKVFGLRPEDNEKLRRAVVACFGASVIEDTPRLDSFRTNVPRDWRLSA